MLILCSECGHRLRAGAVHSGAFGIVECFDDGAESVTYREQVTRCPGCSPRLYHDLGIEPSDVGQPG